MAVGILRGPVHAPGARRCAADRRQRPATTCLCHGALACSRTAPATCRSPSTRRGAARSPGRMDDPERPAAPAGGRHEENPAVRVESVGLLKRAVPASSEVRDALLNALAHDPNAGVRLKALEGLKGAGGRPAGAEKRGRSPALRRQSGRSPAGRGPAGDAPRRLDGGHSTEACPEGGQRLRAPEMRKGAEGLECVGRAS